MPFRNQQDQGRPVAILDEGVVLTPSVTSIDFVGGGVTGSVIGSAVTESIPAGGGGTVTSVSVTTANGVSGVVANPTTTPAITLTLGAITPTTVNGLTVTATNGTLTLANGSSLVTSGANSITLTSAGATNVTLPTSGTLMANPMTTGGDVIYGGASGAPTRLANGSSGQVLTSNGTTSAPSWQTNAGGDVTGPASSTDEAIARFNSTTGKLLQNSTVTLDDGGSINELNAIFGETDQHFRVETVSTTTVAGRDITLTASSAGATSGNSDGGSVILEVGEGHGSGVVGKVKMTDGTDTAIISLASLSADRDYLLPNQGGTFTVLGNTTTGTGVIVLQTDPTFIQKITVGENLGVTGSIEFKGTTSGTVTLKSADAAGTWTGTLPTNDGDSGQFLQTNGSGVMTWAAVTAGTATAITVADETADTSSFPVFVTAATGSLGPKTNAGLTFNSATSVLTATGFAGPLTGDVTGNVSGTAATVTSASQAAITTLANLVSVQGKTLTLGGNFITSGASSLTLTTGGATNVTLPTTGTLATLAGSEALSNKTYNGLTITANGTNTLNIAAGKTLVVSNSLTLAGTDSTVMTFPTTSATIARTDAANAFTGASTASAWVLTAPTITTSIVPTNDDSAALGSTSKQFSDLFLAEGGVINWDNGDATLTQTGNDITIAGITTFGVGTSTAVTLGTIELGAASDTTLARVSAGVMSVEGVRVITSAGTTSGTILKNNGTTFVASTETYAAPGTSGNVLTSDGTNWTSATPAAGGIAAAPVPIFGIDVDSLGNEHLDGDIDHTSGRMFMTRGSSNFNLFKRVGTSTYNPYVGVGEKSVTGTHYRVCYHAAGDKWYSVDFGTGARQMSNDDTMSTNTVVTFSGGTPSAATAVAAFGSYIYIMNSTTTVLRYTVSGSTLTLSSTITLSAGLQASSSYFMRTDGNFIYFIDSKDTSEGTCRFTKYDMSGTLQSNNPYNRSRVSGQGFCGMSFWPSSGPLYIGVQFGSSGDGFVWQSWVPMNY